MSRYRLLQQILASCPFRFPDPLTAPGDTPLATGGDLEPDTLLLAYARGIFPWSVHPITWWSPDPRGILPLAEFHVPRRLLRKVRQERFRISFDEAFSRVMAACAVPKAGRAGTWISSQFQVSYERLHKAGWAHSVEAWDGDELIGGVYGVVIGGLFAGESMFHQVTDAGKVALVHLVHRLCERGFTLFDTQMLTSATAPFGCRLLPRSKYLQRLAAAVKQECPFP